MNKNNFTITIVIEGGDEEITHEKPYYFCSMPSCICHLDELLVRRLLSDMDHGRITGSQAIAFYWNMPQEDRNA